MAFPESSYRIIRSGFKIRTEYSLSLSPSYLWSECIFCLFLEGVGEGDRVHVSFLPTPFKFLGVGEGDRPETALLTALPRILGCGEDDCLATISAFPLLMSLNVGEGDRLKGAFVVGVCPISLGFGESDRLDIVFVGFGDGDRLEIALLVGVAVPIALLAGVAIPCFCFGQIGDPLEAAWLVDVFETNLGFEEGERLEKTFRVVFERADLVLPIENHPRRGALSGD